jgi:hypothetical protein
VWRTLVLKFLEAPYEHDGVNSPAINIKNVLFSDSTLNSSCLFGGGFTSLFSLFIFITQQMPR